MAGLDSNVKLLIHCDGVDESTTFTDYSATGHTITAEGNAQVDTAKQKFGTGSCLTSAFGDYLSVGDHADWDFGANDWTIDCWLYLNSATPSTTVCSRVTGSGNYFYIAWEGGNLRVRDAGGSIDFSRAVTETTGSWFHLAIVRSGTSMYIFKDGVPQGATASVSTTAFIDRAVALEFGRMSDNAGYYLNGWIDEIRVSDVARWTTTFTPPTEEYNANVTITPSVLTITSSVETPTSAVTLTDALVTPSVLTITSSVQTPTFPVIGANINKIINSGNYLLAVTNTSPAKLIKIDISTPTAPVYTGTTISAINTAKDICLDTTGNYVYVSGASGLISKIQISDISSKVTIDLSDTDDVYQIENNSNKGITYAGTDSTTGEIYTLDDRSNFEIDTDFKAVSQETFEIDSDFNIVDAFELDSEFTALAYDYFYVNSDFKCLTKETVAITSIDDIVPIDLSDFVVKIDGVTLGNTDLVMESIEITHSEGTESQATFTLTRKHDDLNHTLEGASSTITSQNTVLITIDGVTVFNGKIAELNCIYSDSQEQVEVTAYQDEPTAKVQTITLSLPSVGARLSLYDVLLSNPRIYNPYINPSNEDNPKKYKGIKVDLGTQIDQHVTSFFISDNGLYNPLNRSASRPGNIAQRIHEGTWNSVPQYTYFWSPTVQKMGEIDLGSTISKHFWFIGTSLAPVTEDLWMLLNASHWRQRKWNDTETELGYYYVGDAPYKEISCRNGVKNVTPYLYDRGDGLYKKTDESYNYVDYAKTVADLEYELLKNINGTVLPDTSCDLTMTIDCYLYYKIGLLTRINIDNTTSANTFNGNNGFPVSAKSITITSADRKVTINADNSKSQEELEIINSQFPDDTDDEYIQAESEYLVAGKTDMKTELTIDNEDS